MIICGVVMITISGWGFRYVKQGFFPDMTYDQLYMEYKLPEGTNYTRVESDLSEIETYLRTRPEVTNITTSVGGTPARYNLVRSIATPSLSYGELIISFTSQKVSKRISPRYNRISPTTTLMLMSSSKSITLCTRNTPLSCRLSAPTLQC